MLAIGAVIRLSIQLGETPDRMGPQGPGHARPALQAPLRRIKKLGSGPSFLEPQAKQDGKGQTGC
jgi:hypothetical protein